MIGLICLKHYNSGGGGALLYMIGKFHICKNDLFVSIIKFPVFGQELWIPSPYPQSTVNDGPNLKSVP